MNDCDNFPSLTIKKIEWNDGTDMCFNSDDIIVLVGANNVGKSRALKKIRDDLLNNSRNKIVINHIEYQNENFDKESMLYYFKKNFTKNYQNDYVVPVYLNHEQFYSLNEFENISNQENRFYPVLFSFLSTESRLNMTSPISYSNIKDKFNFNIMNKLGFDKNTIIKLNEILLSCFDRAIDVAEVEFQNSVSKLYKFGTKEEIDETINSDTRSAREKLKKLENLNEQGDGIRSAVAILASLIANDHSLYLIDEPETFLHPPQARLLGNNIVELSKNKQCFISTHNIDLIRGLLEKRSSRVKIIKIDRENNSNHFSFLDNDSLIKLADDRNLKYSNILNGLFYKQVVLCESESDCKFYSAILESIDNKLWQDTLFCAVGGKDQFKIVASLLKKVQINYLIIADLDLINNRKKLCDLLNSIDDNLYDQISNYHDEFLNLFEKSTNNLVKKKCDIKREIKSLLADDNEDYLSNEIAKKIKDLLKNISSLKLLKSSGDSCLPSGECVNNFNKVIEFLNSNNIFVVECGELERFVKDVGLHGDEWVNEVFKKYPTMKESAYDNAKKFIRKVFKITE